MLSIAFFVSSAYATVCMLLCRADFFKYGGKKWHYASLLILVLWGVGIYALPWVVKLPAIVVGVSTSSGIFVHATLAAVGRRSVIV